MSEDPTVRSLVAISRLDRFDPPVLATFFRREIRLVREVGAHSRYRFVGGTGFPFAEIGLRWARERHGGILHVRLARGLRLPMSEVCAGLAGEGYPSALIPPDIQDSDQQWCVAYRVPAGELRILYSGAEEERVMDSFVLSRSPAVAWE